MYVHTFKHVPIPAHVCVHMHVFSCALMNVSACMREFLSERVCLSVCMYACARALP